MIYTVTLNPAVDELIKLAWFNRNGVSETVSVMELPAGKGINVGRSLRSLGLDSCQVVLLGEESRDFFESGLEESDLPARLFTFPGRVRSSQTLVFLEDGVSTHIKRPGSYQDNGALQELRSFLVQAVEPGDFVVLAGSLPEGVSPGIYQELIRELHERQAVCFLDSSGEALEHGMEAHPFCVKINMDEYIDFAEQSESEVHEFRAAAEDLFSRGVSLIVITMGAEGAVCFNGEEFFHARQELPEDTSGRFVGVGSGDAFMAGLISGLDAGRPLDGALCRAIACGTANGFHDGSGVFPLEAVEKYEESVKLTKEK